MLKGKKILLGVTGGIAAYKTPVLVRLLKKEGAEVKVVATKNALQFVTELTLQTVSQNPVYTDTFSPVKEYSTEHIALAEWADVAVVAPASANSIGKLASGIADDALSTTLLALNKPLFLCPAMNNNMYAHFSVQNNIDLLKKNNIRFIEPAEGFLACGTEGKGRMEEPENICKAIIEYLKNSQELAGKKILVTAGPTYEKIDSVRFIGNHSSGRMGFNLAEELAARGAEVVLVAGPVELKTNSSNIQRIDVVSAREMYEACMKNFSLCDAAILSAAVADYRPEKPAEQKIKKTADELNIKLVQTEDILASLGKEKKKGQVLVGFALETDNETENAIKKLQKKNLDFIVLNSLNDKGAGFGTETNKVTIIDKNEQLFSFPLKSKKEVAKDIVDHLCSIL
ncbi:bifunctional phosphopantothenoylcysteine decarboxylase/phosphopantothenate--cysteine ligase CoaBC [Bacteroidales bacterium OttesenSCG-928-C19]|nr:bifunctional phosphopantothenoylcysteine decarboxylase/phosphopantothenate--cysteine ligase CoaBC [Bacteroidales bacterium OttesenSCG-928-C19]